MPIKYLYYTKYLLQIHQSYIFCGVQCKYWSMPEFQINLGKYLSNSIAKMPNLGDKRI